MTGEHSSGVRHRTLQELVAGLEEVRRAPSDRGTLEMIVRRPRTLEREVVTEGRLDVIEGLVGDNWRTRGSHATTDGLPHPEMQLTLMNSRVIRLVAGEPARWPPAGDQLFVDMDLSVENLPAGTRLTIGSAEIEITAPPHTGCKKFVRRYGVDAMKWVNSPTGRSLRLRGANARVVRPGAIRVGDELRRNADAT